MPDRGTILEMYEPWIAVSPEAGIAVIPVVDVHSIPRGLFIEETTVAGFYRLNNKYYAYLRTTAPSWLRSAPSLLGATRLNVEEIARVPRRTDHNVIYKIVVRISKTPPEVLPWSNVYDKMVIHLNDDPVSVPVKHFFRFYDALTSGFPDCVEMLAEIFLGGGVAKKAAEICRAVYDGDIKTSWSVRAVAASIACIVVAARMCRVPISINELRSLTNIPRGLLNREYRYVLQKLGLSTKDMLLDVGAYIERLASMLFPKHHEIAKSVAEEAVMIYRVAAEKGATTGKDPRSIATAAIYIAANMLGIKISQKQLSALTGLTDVTIRARYRELMEFVQK